MKSGMRLAIATEFPMAVEAHQCKAEDFAVGMTSSQGRRHRNIRAWKSHDHSQHPSAAQPDAEAG